MLFTAGAASTPSISGAQAEYGTPEAVAEAILRADSLRDWRLLLALAHPDALREFRQNQLEMLKTQDFPGFPEMPPCAMKQMQAWHRYLLDSVFHVPGVDSLARLRPDTLFARAQRFRPARPRPPVVPDSLDFAPVRTVLGHVRGDDSTAYVVIEERYTHRPFADWPERRPQIMTVRRYRGAWRSMLDPDVGQGFGSVALMSEECP